MSSTLQLQERCDVDADDVIAKSSQATPIQEGMREKSH